jgi:hypothetical protein
VVCPPSRLDRRTQGDLHSAIVAPLRVQTISRELGLVSSVAYISEKGHNQRPCAFKAGVTVCEGFTAYVRGAHPSKGAKGGAPAVGVMPKLTARSSKLVFEARRSRLEAFQLLVSTVAPDSTKACIQPRTRIQPSPCPLACAASPAKPSWRIFTNVPVPTRCGPRAWRP